MKMKGPKKREYFLPSSLSSAFPDHTVGNLRFKFVPLSSGLIRCFRSKVGQVLFSLCPLFFCVCARLTSEPVLVEFVSALLRLFWASLPPSQRSWSDINSLISLS